MFENYLQFPQFPYIENETKILLYYDMLRFYTKIIVLLIICIMKITLFLQMQNVLLKR